jgi:hypothetical protein
VVFDRFVLRILFIGSSAAGSVDQMNHSGGHITHAGEKGVLVVSDPLVTIK